MGTRTRRGRRSGGVKSAVAACVVACAALFGCTAGDPDPKPSEQPVVSPFTGVTAEPGPVLAVKIDNVQAARPQTGLAAADIVYVEQVEAGLSRLLAVYSSEQPPSVGPVRSARESDIELLRQFGRPALAYSGAQSALLPLIGDAPLYPVTPQDAPGAFVRDGDRAAPHNLYVRPEQALEAAPEADQPRDIGFRFGPAPEGGRPLDEHTVEFPSARFTFTWSAEDERWLVSMDGAPARDADGARLGAPTVVVQYVEVRGSEFQDRSGSVSPYTETVGSGNALVLRDGRGHDARWSRPAADGGTAFTTPSGDRLNFARGPVWVVLAAR
ncbi:DUF3048 domain-containing protein [Streptomyces sp. HNM0663]|uniref:DUF3048 domain-containing protein n=1 Tax=Streptomyces chengmaiensis TaxID=3040919 RepID=A0ABT6HUW7_9ACTN|nr:DUF3048 domain-containing protein [Streptomyces chengmaiensis]MDH2392511.1 DUF3048 domain-containing protein [Streptomyces chengmaiensis]